MWLTRLALRNPVLILMASLMVLILGGVALSCLGLDLFPNIDIPVIRIGTFYPGAGPADIERSITQPIERAVSSSPGIDRVESISKQGVSSISVWFAYGTDIDQAQFDVSQRVSQVLSTLPPGVGAPFVLKFDITNVPVAQVVMTGEGLDERPRGWPREPNCPHEPTEAYISLHCAKLTEDFSNSYPQDFSNFYPHPHRGH
jgi:multidrug efflux pump subunit AcrB